MRLEGPVHGAKGGNDHARLDRTMDTATCSIDLQPAEGSVRAGLFDIQYLLRLVARSRLLPGAGTGFRGKFLATFREFPPRQKAASFNLDQVMEMLQKSSGSK